MKCWDAEAKNRPNAKELYHILKKLEEKEHKDDEIRSQMEEYDKIRKRKLKIDQMEISLKVLKLILKQYMPVDF
jgi:hypothetical protein